MTAPLASVVRHNTSDDVVEGNSGSICDLTELALGKIRSCMSRNSPFSFLGLSLMGSTPCLGRDLM